MLHNHGKSTIRVLVADSQRLLAESMQKSLAMEPDLEILAEEPHSGLGTVEAALRRGPDVVILDYWMGGMEGPAATRLILHRSPLQKILLLGWFLGPVEIQEASLSGAWALLSKDLDIADLADAIREASTGQSPAQSATGTSDASLQDGWESLLSLTAGGEQGIQQAGQQEDAIWQRLVTLTLREIEILGHLAATGRVQGVARHLSLTTGTVRLHIEHILTKIGARSHVEAVVIAREHGLI